jgi:hypothetical protein
VIGHARLQDCFIQSDVLGIFAKRLRAVVQEWWWLVVVGHRPAVATLPDNDMKLTKDQILVNLPALLRNVSYHPLFNAEGGFNGIFYKNISGKKSHSIWCIRE